MEYPRARPDWRTALAPQVKAERTTQIASGAYCVRLNSDHPVRYVLIDADILVNGLFQATTTATTTPVDAAEHAGDITTQDVSTFFVNYTYLHVGMRSNCRILGVSYL